MLNSQELQELTERASRAPGGLYKGLPLTWRHEGTTLYIDIHAAAWRPDEDPEGHFLALACGARIEAAVIALSVKGIGARVANMLNRRLLAEGGPVPVAILLLSDNGQPDPLEPMMDRRRDWSGPFAKGPVRLFGWAPDRVWLVTDQPGKDWIAQLAGDDVLVGDGRANWLRRRPDEPDEARAIRSAALIALHASPPDMRLLEAGRRLYRLWLEATGLGLAGWEMDGLVRNAETRQALTDRYGIGPDLRLDAVIRFGRIDPPSAEEALASL